MTYLYNSRPSKMLETPIDNWQVSDIKNFIPKRRANHKKLVQPGICYFVAFWLLFVLSFRHGFAIKVLFFQLKKISLPQNSLTGFWVLVRTGHNTTILLKFSYFFKIQQIIDNSHILSLLSEKYTKMSGLLSQAVCMADKTKLYLNE